MKESKQLDLFQDASKVHLLPADDQLEQPVCVINKHDHLFYRPSAGEALSTAFRLEFYRRYILPHKGNYEAMMQDIHNRRTVMQEIFRKTRERNRRNNNNNQA